MQENNRPLHRPVDYSSTTPISFFIRHTLSIMRRSHRRKKFFAVRMALTLCVLRSRRASLFFFFFSASGDRPSKNPPHMAIVNKPKS